MSNALSYDALLDKITEVFEVTDVSEWQDTLTKLLETHGWSREDWEAEVSRRFDEYSNE